MGTKTISQVHGLQGLLRWCISCCILCLFYLWCLFLKRQRLPILVIERLGPDMIPVYRQSVWQKAVITFCHACFYLPSRRASPPRGRYKVNIAWWQRHIGVNNLLKVTLQLLPQVGFEPTTCWSQIQNSATVFFHMGTFTALLLQAGCPSQG